MIYILSRLKEALCQGTADFHKIEQTQITFEGPVWLQKRTVRLYSLISLSFPFFTKKYSLFYFMNK